MSDPKINNIWSVINPDTDEITMSNQVYDDPDGRYGHLLADRGYKFVNHAGPSHANPGKHFHSNGEIIGRPRMRTRISRTTIGIGEANGATISNVPIGAVLTICAGGMQFFSERIAGTRVEISAPVPGIYTLVVSKFPFRDWTAEVVAQ